MGAARGRRDLGRPAQRHRRPARPRGAPGRGPGGATRRPGRGRQRGWRHGHDLPPLQGRHRHRVAAAAGGRRAAGRWACWSRRTTASRDRLTIDGVPVGREIPLDARCPTPVGRAARRPADTGSIIVVVATDAPLLPSQCERLAQRAGLGIARVGGAGAHSSGDLFLCFSTANRGMAASDTGTGPPRVRAASPRSTTPGSRRSSGPSSRRPRRRSSTRSWPRRR